MNIIFQNLSLSWMFLLLPILIIVDIYVTRKNKKSLNLFINPKSAEKLLRSLSKTKRNIKRVAFYLSILFLILGLMRPKWGKKIIKIEQKGIDIMFLLDVSKSMLAEDIKPNRLTKARIQISTFLNKLHGDRVGITLFAGSSFVLSPLTLDYQALRMFLENIAPGMIQRQGTLLGDALKTARDSLTEYNSKSRAIILLTDGEDHGTLPIMEAKECKKNNIVIYCIGLGKRDGEPIPIKDKNGNFSDYLKDKSGKVVMSRLDEMTLDRIAKETGGIYYYSQFGDFELNQIYDHINKMTKSKLGSKTTENYKERFQIFLIIALTLYFFSLYFPERRLSKLEDLKQRFQNNINGRYE